MSVTLDWVEIIAGLKFGTCMQYMMWAMSIPGEVGWDVLSIWMWDEIIEDERVRLLQRIVFLYFTALETYCRTVGQIMMLGEIIG